MKDSREKAIGRRDFIKYAGVGGAALLGGGDLLGFLNKVHAQTGAKNLTIAFNLDVPSWDAQAYTMPKAQSLYKAVFDQYLTQTPDLKLVPHVIREWTYSGPKKTTLDLKMITGAKFHNGDSLTPEDIKFSLDYARDPKSPNPVKPVWGNIKDVQVTGNDSVRLTLGHYAVSLVKWFSFLTAFIYPKKYFESKGREGFMAAPIGTGPYRIAEYVRASHLKLEAFEDHWNGAPKIKNVIFKFVPEATSRVAEIESGRSDLTLEIPFEEWYRLRKKPGLKAIAQPVSDIALIFLEESGPFADENLRMAAHHAIDKNAIVKRLMLGFGRPQSTLEASEYDAYIPDYYFPYDMDLAREYMAKTGHSPKNPIKINFQTTNGVWAKDYELVQVVVAMWKKIGIEAKIEVLELAKLADLRYAGKLADASFYMWGNASGDPENSTGFLMFGPAPFNVFDSPEVDKMIGPLFSMLDEEKRLEEYKKVARYVIEHSMAIPLFQAIMPIVMKESVQFTPYANNWILPQAMDRT